MRILFDSSVLIAGCVQLHPKHHPARSWIKRAKNKEVGYVVSAHSVLEVYSVLTGAPFRPRISPSTAKMLIDQNIKTHAEIITLSDKDYFRVIDRMDRLGLRGGVVYDAIVVECARKSKSNEIITSNSTDFYRLIPDESINIITL